MQGFGRRPQHDRAHRLGAGVRKPLKEETAGRKGCVCRRARYGDLKAAVSARLSLFRALAQAFDGLVCGEAAVWLAARGFFQRSWGCNSFGKVFRTQRARARTTPGAKASEIAKREEAS